MNQKCDICGKEKETRPYGPKGENVCFSCAMKDEVAARRAFVMQLAGCGQVAVLTPNGPMPEKLS